MRLAIKHINNSLKLDSNMLDMIKADDPSWIGNLGLNPQLSPEIYNAVAEHNAIKTFVALSKLPQNKFYGIIQTSLLCGPKCSKRMKQLFHDIYGIHMEISSCENIELFIDDERRQKLSTDSSSQALQAAIKRNDYKAVRYIVDNYIIFPPRHHYEKDFPYIDNNSNIDPDLYIFLLERGIHVGSCYVPAFAFERNLIEFINTLRNKYDFLIDPTVISSDVLKNMVRNNAFEAIQLLIQEYLSGKQCIYLSDVFLYCATFNCLEIIDMVLQQTKDKLKPGYGDEALEAACRLGRSEIVNRIVSFNLVTLDGVVNGIFSAYQNGFKSLARKLRNSNLEMLPRKPYFEKDTKLCKV